MLSMTDDNVMLHISLDVVGRCYLPRMWWLQCLCNRCYSHLYCSGWWKPHYLEIIISCIVTDGKSHRSGWCYCHNGRCYCHIIVGWCLTMWKMENHMCDSWCNVIVADGIATWLFGWCYCHGRWNSHIGWNGLRQMLLPLWQMLYHWAYYIEKHSTYTIKCGYLAKNNIFPYTRWSHVRWTGKSLCSRKKLFCSRENRVPYQMFYCYHFQAGCNFSMWKLVMWDSEGLLQTGLGVPKCNRCGYSERWPEGLI